MSKTRLTVAVAILCPWLWLFGRVLLSSESFVFRDAAHYYYPLFQWSAAQWGAGRVPLWNPQGNLGVPALADSTTSVFYPGKLVFVLPLAYATLYKLYIVAHVLLAAASAYWLARQWAASVLGAGMAALSYALGGSVVFLYCNVVFLVGAAWLPVSLRMAERMLTSRRWGDCAGFGATLALMTLGGDPQMAYHAGLLACVYALILWLADRPRPAHLAPETGTPNPASVGSVTAWPRWLRTARVARQHRATLLLLAAVFGALLAAVQVLPSTRWTWHSHRAAHPWPRSLYEVPTYLSQVQNRRAPETRPIAPPRRDLGDVAHGIAKGLLGRPQPDTHHADSLQFSVGPWRWAELLWPNVSGRQFPIHRRWIEAVPAEGRVWTPTLYMGLLPVILGLGTLRLGPRHGRRAWLSWMFVLAVAGSLGVYGVGWLIDQLRFAVGGDAAGQTWLGPQVGGLYWLMTLLLPGYVLFRYPAKLLAIATLALCLLAALGWDRAWNERASRLRATLAVLGVVSLLAAGLVLSARTPIETWLESVPPDRLFGPLDVTGAWIDMLMAFLHTAMVSLLLWWVWSRAYRGRRTVWQCVMVIVCAAELTVAQSWLVPCASESIWQQEPAMGRAIGQDSRRRSRVDGFRVFRASTGRWRPETWRSTSSPSRQVDGLRWDRATMYPRHHLATDLAMVESRGAFIAADLHQLLDVARLYGEQRLDGRREPYRPLLDALSAKYLVLPAGLRLPDTEPVNVPGPSKDIEDARLWYNPHCLPRVWIVHEVQQLAELPTRDPASMEHRTKEVLLPDGRPRDLQRSAVVESDVDFRRAPVLDRLSSGSAAQRESTRLVRDDPQRIEVEVRLTRPGLVILSDLFYPGWTARVSIQGDPSRRFTVPILRTNRVLRGVYLPAGSHRLVYQYGPWLFSTGAAISVVSGLALGVWAGFVLWKRRHQRQNQ